uniref:ATP binding cassette subfamily B member 8 n=1 Tax=Chrysolophus pictus TaxID=9089 RepID=A0A8C3LYF0_CHRPC
MSASLRPSHPCPCPSLCPRSLSSPKPVPSLSPSQFTSLSPLLSVSLFPFISSFPSLFSSLSPSPSLFSVPPTPQLALGAALLNVQIPVLLGQLVDVVARGARTHLEGYLQAARPPALRLLGLYSLQALLTFGYIALLSHVGEKVAASMRKALFVSLLRQDVAFFDAHRTGQLVARLTADVQEFKSSFKLIISQGLRSSTQAAGCVLSLYLLSPRLTALLLLVLPVLVSAGTALGSVLRALSRQAQEQVAKATGVADEVLGNVRTVRAFAMEERQELRTFSGGQDLFWGAEPIGGRAPTGIVLGTIFVGGSLMAGDQLSPGDLMSFLVASQTVQRSLANISILFGQVVRGLSAGARVFEFMTLEPQVPLRGGDTIPSHSLLGQVAFKHVAFSYPTRPGHPVLQDFSLTLPPGETVAIVGPSGGGKSTVAALLERFYEPTRGTITLDGRDIASLDPSWLRGRRVAYFLTYPHVTKLDEVAAHNLTFPAITICNLNEFRFSKITRNDMYHVGELLALLNERYEISNPQLAEPAVLAALRDKANFKNFKAKPFSMAEFYNRTGHDLADMLLQCSFRGAGCSARNFSVVSEGP